MNKIFVAIICLLCIISCDNENEPPGRLSSIGLKEHLLSIDSEESNIIVQTKDINWFIMRSLIVINGNTSILKNTTYEYTPIPGQVTDITQYKDTLKGDWFTAIKNGNELLLHIDVNTSQYERVLIVELSGGGTKTEELKIIQNTK